MIEVSMKCPCGTHAVVDITAAYTAENGWSCHCPGCYDGTEDSGPRAQLIGYGKSPEEAIAAWWESAEQAWEIDYEPNPLFAAISEQAGDEADRQSGWVKTLAWLDMSRSTDYWGPPQ